MSAAQMSPALKRRVLAQRSAQRSTAPDNWGYYPSTRYCRDEDPEVAFRGLCDVLMYSVMSAIAEHHDLRWAKSVAWELFEVIDREGRRQKQERTDALRFKGQMVAAGLDLSGAAKEGA